MKITALAPWFGAKRFMAPEIVRQLGPHNAYWEPFCGSMSVLLAKPEVSQETVNDMHGDLMNLAIVIADDELGPRLYRRLRRTLVHESIFAAAETECLQGCLHDIAKPNLERACWFFVASWLGRNGVVGTTKGSCGKQFCVRYTSNGGIQGTRFRAAVNSIPAWRRRLSEVTMLRRDGMDLLERIDDATGTVIYCDPPYLEKSAKYVHDFENEDHARLAELLARFRRARVVVSYYAHPLLADLYPGWTTVKVEVAKSLTNQGRRGKEGKTMAPECLIINGEAYGNQSERCLW